MNCWRSRKRGWLPALIPLVGLVLMLGAPQSAFAFITIVVHDPIAVDSLCDVLGADLLSWATCPAGSTNPVVQSLRYDLGSNPITVNEAVACHDPVTFTIAAHVDVWPVNLTTPPLTGLTVSPSTIHSGEAALATATLSCTLPNAHLGFATYPIASDSAAASAGGGDFQGGTNTITFPVTANDVASPTNATLSITLAGVTQTAMLTVLPLYQITPLYDQTKAVKSGATVPIKLQVLNSSGVNVSSSALVVHATGVVSLSTSAPGTLIDAGDANPDSDFRYDATLGGYIFNLKTAGLSGTYALQFTIGGSGPYSVQFQVK